MRTGRCQPAGTISRGIPAFPRRRQWPGPCVLREGGAHVLPSVMTVPFSRATMRITCLRMLLPLVLVAAACDRGGPGSSALPDDLKRDLSASSAKPELVGSSSGYQAMQVVSELEQVNGSVPAPRARAPRQAIAERSVDVRQAAAHAPAPETSPEPQVAPPPAESPEPNPAPVSDAPSVPSVAPRPAALPVDVPTQVGGGGGYGDGGIGSGRGEGRGPGIGDVIGVVIRGGGVGPDHCPPRRRPGRPRFPIIR